MFKILSVLQDILNIQPLIIFNNEIKTYSLILLSKNEGQKLLKSRLLKTFSD